MINVTKTYLPPFEEYTAILKRAWDKAWITNNGILVQELEQKLKDYLGVKHLLFCGNGTVVLQMALKAYGINGEVITTPFSYVATTNIILWEGCTPVFADINANDFCINTDMVESLITEKTQAILATHVYGYPCNIEKIAAIAARHKLKVIYDGAHAFGCRYNDKSLLSYGDISTCSFHATKVFHTVEGGCIITSDDVLMNKLKLFRSFGHIGDDYFSVGINGKNSEFHAAMGICNLVYIDEIIEARKKLSECYDQFLDGFNLQHPVISPELKYNYAYYPVIFESEADLKRIAIALQNQQINTRRYFYPSLNKLPFLAQSNACPVSEDIASRVLSLPLYYELARTEIERICRIIRKHVR